MLAFSLLSITVEYMPWLHLWKSKSSKTWLMKNVKNTEGVALHIAFTPTAERVDSHISVIINCVIDHET